MSSFIDSGVGLLLYIWSVLALLLKNKPFYKCKDNDLGVACNEWTNHLWDNTAYNLTITGDASRQFPPVQQIYF